MSSKSARKGEQSRREREMPEYVESYDEIKRLNRVIGQIEGIKKMLEEGRPLDDILMQSKAVHSALKSVETRLLKRYLDEALRDISRSEKRKNKEQKIAELIDLYRPVM